jgi:hypothetical protein
MDTSEINNLLSNEKSYLGTFARDLLPFVEQGKTSALIVNTDTSDKEGEHWVAMIFKGDGTGEYFDSYGLPPLHKEFTTYMENNCPLGWGFNRVTLQCLSCITCGHYCILYVKLRLLGYSYCDFISLFSCDRNINDSLIKNLINALISKKIK